jgi:hypothetical protein
MRLTSSLLLFFFLGVASTPAAVAADSLAQRRPAAPAPDSVHRFAPSIESILEDAGEDQQGASVFLDEMEYYRLHPSLSPDVVTGFEAPASSFSSFQTRDLFGGTDSTDITVPTESSYNRQYFPLQADRTGSFFDNMSIVFRSTIEKDLVEPKGVTDQKWNGSPVHSVQKLQLHNAPYSAGVLVEHDPGERFSNGFVEGYAAVRGIGILDQLVVGMYTVNAGEGLVLSRASLFSKGTMSITQTKKYGAALVPYLSRDEFHFFRGAAGTLHAGMWSVTGFLSHRTLPATVSDGGSVTSFYTSGLFRSETEMRKIGAVTEKSGGLIATITPLPAASITLTTVAAGYDKPIAATHPYAFATRSMRTTGISFNAALPAMAVFGELAGHGLNSLNGVLGTVYRAAHNFSFAVHLRSFSDEYNDPFARAFSERGQVNGERGIYFGIDWNIARSLGLFAYVDHFTISDPLLFNKKGVDYVMRLDGTTVKTFAYSVQMKYKTHSLFTEPDNNGHPIVDDHRRTTLRFQVRYTSAGQYTLTQRCNLTRVSYAIDAHREKGFLLSTDIAKRYDDIGLGVRAGIAFFDTDSYDSGLSVYEPDVRGSATTSILFGQGTRWFVMVDQSVSSSVQLSLKYGSLSKWNVASLGSGDDELIGNTDPQLTFQADVAL